MTSKERLLNILKDYKLANKGNGDFLSNKQQEELLNPVLKDLERLEKQDKAIKILKDYIEYEELGETQAGYMFRAYFNDTLNYEETEVLKEVLEKRDN